jgi:hypothetical protein
VPSVLLTIPPSRAGVFAVGCVLVAIGEVIVETRPEDFNHRLTLGGLIVAGGILVHYLIARMLAACDTFRQAMVRAAPVLR